MTYVRVHGLLRFGIFFHLHIKYMNATDSVKILVPTSQNARRHLPQNHNHYTWCREKLKCSDTRNLSFVKGILWNSSQFCFNQSLLLISSLDSRYEELSVCITTLFTFACRKGHHRSLITTLINCRDVGVIRTI